MYPCGVLWNSVLIDHGVLCSKRDKQHWVCQNHLAHHEEHCLKDLDFFYHYVRLVHHVQARCLLSVS